MGIKKYKPHTPGLRTRATLDFSELTTDKPEKSLTSGFAPCAGRGASGRISVRRRGGGHKRKYRIIDFRRDKFDVPGKVVTIEYDPNRSANIALINYVDGEKRYILAPKGLKVGDMIQSGPAAPIKVGNALPLENIPLGVSIHNIELTSSPWFSYLVSLKIFIIHMSDSSIYNCYMPACKICRFKRTCSSKRGRLCNTQTSFHRDENGIQEMHGYHRRGWK